MRSQYMYSGAVNYTSIWSLNDSITTSYTLFIQEIVRNLLPYLIKHFCTMHQKTGKTKTNKKFKQKLKTSKVGKRMAVQQIHLAYSQDRSIDLLTAVL